MDRSYAADRMGFAVRLKDKAKICVVAIAVPAIGKCLPRVAVTEVINDIAADAPRMTGGNTPWMAPY